MSKPRVAIFIRLQVAQNGVKNKKKNKPPLNIGYLSL